MLPLVHPGIFAKFWRGLYERLSELRAYPVPRGPLRSNTDTTFTARHRALLAKPAVGESFASFAVNGTEAKTH